MLNLFLKDAKAGGIFLWAVVPLNVVAALQMSRSSGAFFWANVTCAALILVAVSMLEWKNDAEPFVHSLPVTRAMVVRGRYLTAAAVGLLSLLVGATVGTARGLGLAAQGMPWPRWVSGDTALAFLLAFAVIAAIYLPCHFRWGFGKGNVAAALVLAAGIVVSSIFGPAVVFVPAAAAGRAARGGVPPGHIPQGVALLVEHVGLAAGGIIVMALAAGLLAVSAQVASRGYERREF
jgi:ABC-2 type transport system permease protein